MRGFKNITVRESLAKILKIEAKRLGYKSIGTYIEALNNVRTKNGFTKLDLEILANYGLENYEKISKSIVIVTGKTDEEAMSKLGLEDAKKVSESFPTVQVEVKAKKKQRKQKKINKSRRFDDMQTRIPEMPKSSEFFKEKS